MDACKFTMAAMLGKWEDLKQIIIKEKANDIKYDINTGDAQSALRLACKCNLDVVKFFAEQGADLNFSDPAETSTPLLSACYAGDLDIASFLVDKGAEVNFRDTLGNIPLVQQIEGPNPNPKLVDFLIKRGADVNCLNENGRPVIVSAKLRKLEKVIEILKSHKAKDEEPTEEEWMENRSREDDDNNDYDDGGDDRYNFFAPNPAADRFLREFREKEDINDEENLHAAMSFNQIGSSYLDYDGDYEAAIDFFQQAIEACPSYKNPYYNIIRAYKEILEYNNNTKEGTDNENNNNEEVEKEIERYSKLYKTKFGSEIEEVDFEEFMDDQEKQREEILYSLPNVSVLRLGGNYDDDNDHA